MPANVVDYSDLRVQRWNGMMFRKFNPTPIQKLPLRWWGNMKNSREAIICLVNLLSEDHLALAMWEAL